MKGLVMLSVNRGVPVEARVFKDNGMVPNSRLPVLTYRGAITITNCITKFGMQTTLDDLQKWVALHDWEIQWTAKDSVFPELQYRSWTHEVLIVLKGQSTLQFGQGKKAQNVEIASGDLLAIPAGVGYKTLGNQPGLIVVGVYPKGQRRNTCRAIPEVYERAKDELPRVKMPKADPLYGKGGPLMKQWAAVSQKVAA